MPEPVLDALWAAFDQLSVAVLILSASGRILFVNRAANDMLEAGWPIRLLDGCLQGKDRGVSAALKQAMDLVSSSEQGAEAGPYEVCLAHPSADRPGAIAELRLLTFADAEPAIALFIMQAGQTSHHGIDGLAEAFGLSKAEARILKALAETQDPAEAAVRLNLALSTVKSHLRKIFQKTSTSRQADLLRLVDSCRTPFRKSDKAC
ncbi:MAG: helix-turn-helix transcriptional regulator [Rhodomicrobium sp.]